MKKFENVFYKMVANLCSVSFICACIMLGVMLTGCSVSTTDPSAPSTVATVDESGFVKPLDPLAQPGAPAGEISNARNILVVLDGSGSMAGQPMYEAKQALHAYVNGLHPDINLSFVVFVNDEIRTVVPFGSSASKNRREFLAQVEAVEAGGGTPLVEAIEEATTQLLTQCQRQLNYGDFRMVVVTDGDATGRKDYDTVCSRAASFGFPIYTIGFNLGDDHALRQWATSYETASNAQELARTLQNTAAEPENYVPTYSPTTPTK